MMVKIERISAITLKVAEMEVSVQFYRDVLGMKLVYGGKDPTFLITSHCRRRVADPQPGTGHPVTHWGRMIFHVTAVDAFWALLKERGFDPQRPHDASWGERYFHMHDPDGHELSFACPL
jgi:catechol 2,3-dioxygenase-like lactoylglutathione lyase family enzyme